MKQLKNDQNELERFKKEINLSEYAASLGYLLDQKESTSKKVIMRLPERDSKIEITKSAKTGNYIYFDWKTQKGGNILNLWKEFKGNNIGSARKELRLWIGENSRPKTATKNYVEKITPIEKNIQNVQDKFNSFKSVDSHNYLLSRNISKKIMSDQRFKGTFFEDNRKNVVFPYVNNKMDVTAYESINNNFKHLSKGGEKGVWFSKTFASDKKLIIAESPIDAMSYHEIKGTHNNRYLSIGGQMSSKGLELIKMASKKMESKGGELILAVDKDRAGKGYIDKIMDVIKDIKIKKSIDHATLGKDWNDQLILSKHKKNKGISEKTFKDDRFEGKIRVLGGNLTYQYFNGNREKELVKEGSKTKDRAALWCSKIKDSDNTLVICATPQEALRHFEKHQGKETRYIATGGAINDIQKGLLKSAAKKINELNGNKAKIEIYTKNKEIKNSLSNLKQERSKKRHGMSR